MGPFLIILANQKLRADAFVSQVTSAPCSLVTKQSCHPLAEQNPELAEQSRQKMYSPLWCLCLRSLIFRGLHGEGQKPTTVILIQFTHMAGCYFGKKVLVHVVYIPKYGYPSQLSVINKSNRNCLIYQANIFTVNCKLSLEGIQIPIYPTLTAGCPVSLTKIV